MYYVYVQTTFCAMHRVRLPDGTLEPLHGHDWGIRACFSREELDALGMVVDFDQARAALEGIAAGWHHRNLNELPAFEGVEPTAERVARIVYEVLRRDGLVTVCRVEVTEAPGCVAAYDVVGEKRA